MKFKNKPLIKKKVKFKDWCEANGVKLEEMYDDFTEDERDRFLKENDMNIIKKMPSFEAFKKTMYTSDIEDIKFGIEGIFTKDMNVCSVDEEEEEDK